MNEQEILELIGNMRDNLSVSDIIAMLTALAGAAIALYSAVRARFSREQSKANAEQAKQYAANADAANQAAKKYYEKWLEAFEAKGMENENTELKKKILLLCQDKQIPISKVAADLSITNEKARELLEELRLLDNYKVFLCPEVKNLGKNNIIYGSITLRPNKPVILPKPFCENHFGIRRHIEKGVLEKIGNEVYVSVERQEGSRQFQ